MADLRVEPTADAALTESYRSAPDPALVQGHLE